MHMPHFVHADCWSLNKGQTWRNCSVIPISEMKHFQQVGTIRYFQNLLILFHHMTSNFLLNSGLHYVFDAKLAINLIQEKLLTHFLRGSTVQMFRAFWVPYLAFLTFHYFLSVHRRFGTGHQTGLFSLHPFLQFSQVTIKLVGFSDQK